MIINIRGTSGSGKTWVARQLIDRWGIKETVGVKKGYLLDTPAHDTFLLGKYAEAGTGGADTIKDMNEVERIVLEQAGLNRHVVFEGIRVNGVYNRWIDAARKSSSHVWQFIILETPLAVCIDNVNRRRFLAGNNEQVSVSVRAGIDDHYRRSRRNYYHFRDAALNVYKLSSEGAVLQINEWIGL